jgi:hypothetical protein
MVFPVRIRVPLLKKALQIEEIERTPAELLAPRDKGVSTAGSRRGFFWRGCGVGVDGEGHSIIVRKPKPEAFRPTLALQPGSREVPEAGRCALAPPSGRLLFFLEVWCDAFSTPRTVLGEDLSEWGSSPLSSPNRVEAGNLRSS